MIPRRHRANMGMVCTVFAGMGMVCKILTCGIPMPNSNHCTFHLHQLIQNYQWYYKMIQILHKCHSRNCLSLCINFFLYYLTDLFGQKWQALKKRNITQNHINETIRKCYCLQVDCPGNSNILPCEETCTMWIMAELVQGATLKD